MKRGLILILVGSLGLLGGVETILGQVDFCVYNSSPTTATYVSWDLYAKETTWRDEDNLYHSMNSGTIDPLEQKCVCVGGYGYAVHEIYGTVSWYSGTNRYSEYVDYFNPDPAVFRSGPSVIICSQYGNNPPNANTNHPNSALADQGEPINTINGAVTMDATDIAIPCPGIPLSFERSYNSTLNYTGPLGPRWTHTFNWTLTPTNVSLPGSTIPWRVVQTGSGETWTYQVITNNVFAPTFDNDTRLTFTNSTYTLAFPGGVNYFFGTNGSLQSIGDSWNNQVSLSYTNVLGTNLLLSAAHNNGQYLIFGYQSGLLNNVTTPSTNLSVQFTYNSFNELTGVVTRTSTSVYPTAYLYDFAANYRNHSLTQKVNAVGDVYSWEYALNADGSATSKGIRSLIDANYIDSRFAYNQNGTNCTTLETIRGTNTIFNDYWFNQKQQRITAVAGPCPSSTNCATAGRGVQYGYDGLGNATSIHSYDNTLGIELSTSNQFDTCHNLTITASAYCANPSNAYSFGWNTNWNVMTSMTDPDGHQIAMQYNNGAISKVSLFYTASNSFDTVFNYTTNGLLSSVTNANGHGGNFLYDNCGNLAATIPQLGPSNSMAWDSLGHLTNITLCGGTWTSDTNGNSSLTPRTIAFAPDELGRNKEITWPDASFETFGWDAIGNLTNCVDRGGRTTSLTWLPTGKLASRTRYLAEAGNQAATIGFNYDQQFNTLQITDELGRSVESYQLDLQDRPVSVSNVESQQMTIVWGLGSMIGSITRFDGTTNFLAYNSDGMLQQSAFPDDANNFTYYKNGLPKTASNNGGAVSNQIDGVNRLVMTTSAVPHSAVNYTYFPAGQVSNVVSVAGTSSYTLDAADRLQNQTILRPGAVADSVAYFYNPDNGLVAELDYNNYMTYMNSFDFCDRITSLGWTGPSNNVLASRSYIYNITGTLDREIRETGEQANFIYDSLDRLTSETHFDPAGEAISCDVYGYDLAGNRTNKTVYGSDETLLATVNYTLGAGNRLASWSVAEAALTGRVDVAGHSSKPIGTDDDFGLLEVRGNGEPVTPTVSGPNFVAYGVSVGQGTQQVVAAIRDQAGNMGFATNTICMTVVTNGTYLYNTAGCLTNIQYSGKQYSKTVGLAWNGQYQLTAVSTNGVAAERYGFDALGRRSWIWDGTATNFLVYDGAQVIAEVDATGGLKRSYAYGPGIDQAISMAVYSGGASSDPAVYYYLRDRLGSVLALTDANGNIVEYYRYDAWGRTTVFDANGNALRKSAVGNRIGFQGREYSWTTELYYFRARWADPTTGRWLSPDPIGINGGLNQYVFCANNPVNFTDPFGLDPANDAYNWAQGQLGNAAYGPNGTLSLQWGKGKEKCNKFVADAYNKGAGKKIIPDGWLGRNPPTAFDWWDGKVPPGFVQTAHPVQGDVATSGPHMGLVSEPGMTCITASSIVGKVHENDWGFRNGQSIKFYHYVPPK